MNTNRETNINVRTNVIDSSMKFRISYERPEGKEHKRYIPQYAENGSDVWKRFVYYHNDKEINTEATFSSPKKAKRFLRKVLIGNGIDVPAEFCVNEDNN
jgi:hypothetical protein